ncbi:hypothetical protein BCR42DRAFT_399861 [Absidia repens]|uniref:Uncharacterized protein n=1 Tax=Absidia repens TaxID=90262 RepID=A0A1X2J0F7_9FUNG|nr:hypothetical protein BCR42DRAFT_399861 [Absidia repens]
MESANGTLLPPRSGRPSTPSNGKTNVTRRNADRERELQQLKTRGVVAVLNKTFDSQDNYVLAPALPPNSSLTPSSANSHSNRAGRKPTSSGAADLHTDGVIRISTKQTMLYDDAPMASPSDITNNAGLPLRKSQNRDYRTEVNTHDVLNHSNKDDSEGNDAALFHIDNHTSLINQYKHMAQQIQHTEEELASCRLEQQQMEHSTQQIMEKALTQKEAEVVKAQQLSTVVLKQDQIIHELEFALSSVLLENDRLRQQRNSKDDDCLHEGVDDMDKKTAIQDEMVDLRQELEKLRASRTGYEKRIVSLCNELESSQDETKNLAAMMEAFKQQCHQQQLQIDEKIEKMMLQLADKNDLIRKYKDERRNHRTDMENQQFDQIVDRSTIVPGTVSMDKMLSRSSNSIPPPTGPPPSSPLPALPLVGVSAQVDHTANEITEHPSPHGLTSDDELNENVLTPSMEMLLLQAPASYYLTEETMMDDSHRQYTEQLINRLSISKEMDHLEVWDHAALERLQHQQQLKRASLAPTTTTGSSSKWSDRSSSAFESDWDDTQRQSTFWKGMKKKLRV